MTPSLVVEVAELAGLADQIESPLYLSTYRRIHRLLDGAFAFTFVLFYVYVFSHLEQF